MLREPVREHQRKAVLVYNPEAPLQGDSSTDWKLRKKRVAAYARVSTELDAQQGSYEAQIDFYTTYIHSKPEWEFVGIYADEGTTGTSTKHRDEFKRMIDDALNGKIDLILTKSISRFARNVVDALTVSRNLKAKGVEVYFEKENLSSTDPRAEMIFTFLCTVAQEESRSISENVRWGVQRSMEAGKINLAYNSFLGYEKGEDGLPKIVEEEAKIVRLIYQWYLEGLTMTEIAERLEEDGYLTPRKCKKWSVSTIRSILTNEKYRGDARLQKTYTVDYLTKEVRVNQGERKQWYIHDSHDAIIAPETFELVQQELARRSGNKGKHFRSPFTGKIVCGDCGANYGHRVWHSNTRYRQQIWLCIDKYANGSTCRPPRVTDAEMEQAFLIVLNGLFRDKEKVIADCEAGLLPIIANVEPLYEQEKVLKAEMLEINTEIEKLIRDNSARQRNQVEHARKYEQLKQRLTSLQKEVNTTEQHIANLLTTQKQSQIFLKALKECGNSCLRKFHVPTWHALVDHAKIMADRTINFQLRNGSTISVSLEEAKRRL